MLEFRELRITPDGNNLIIDVAVKSLSYYENVFIDSIIIDTLDTYIQNGPSSAPLYQHKIDEGAKLVTLVLSAKDIPLNNMLFVYAIAKGTPAPDTPCGMDNSIIMNTAVNLYPIYQLSIKYMHELNCECNIPKGFIDMILRYKSIELCIKTGNYVQAIKYWKKFSLGINSTTSYKCRCNGTVN